MPTELHSLHELYGLTNDIELYTRACTAAALPVPVTPDAVLAV